MHKQKGFPRFLSNLTLVLTEECNFSCVYCRQHHSNRKLEREQIREALDSFLPKMKMSPFIHFYGGEPLLQFNSIQETVRYIVEKHDCLNPVYFTVTTNGALLDQGKLDFFNHYRFTVSVSFDGAAQEDSRKKGSTTVILEILKAMKKYSSISWRIHSVFTPETVNKMSESVRLFIDLGILDFTFYSDKRVSWNELSLKEFQHQLRLIREVLLKDSKKNGHIRLSNFRSPILEASTYTCGAGKKGLTLSADGRLWGCSVAASLGRSFPEIDRFCFGTVSEFFSDFKKYKQVTRRYRSLRVDKGNTVERPCKNCIELPFCKQCLLQAAEVSGRIGLIPDWFCNISKIARREKNVFLEMISNSI